MYLFTRRISALPKHMFNIQPLKTIEVQVYFPFSLVQLMPLQINLSRQSDKVCVAFHLLLCTIKFYVQF